MRFLKERNNRILTRGEGDLKVSSRNHVIFFFLSLLVLSATVAPKVSAWSNGGYSSDPSNPDYGTHDWIAQHAMDWLPNAEKQYITDNLATYLYGTELPDNAGAVDGIGDKFKHHIYYSSGGVMTDDAAAVRASEVYDEALTFLVGGDLVNAAKNAGIMAHYIADMAVFGHVMGSGTNWGAEQHHSDYETYVNQRTSSYNAEFNSYLSFDGSLTIISAYDATKDLAYDTTFDVDGALTCVWMDQNYNWNNPTFRDRCGESLNLAVNYIADVLHTLYVEAISFLRLEELFFVEGCFTASFGYGAEANAIDTVGGTLVSAWFSSHATGGTDVDVLIDDEVTSVSEVSGPLISIGGPAVNLFWSEYNTPSSWAHFTLSDTDWVIVAGSNEYHKEGNYVYEGGSETDVVTDYAIVQLIWDEENNRPVLLIAGISGHATKAACEWFYNNANDIISEEIHVFILEIRNYGDGTWISTTVSYTA